MIYTSELLGETYLCHTHSSGMQIWFCPKKVSSASAQLGVRYGAADIPPTMPDAPLGVAHFLEHKVFEAPRGESFDMTFAALGAEVNAYTSYDKTVYYINCTRQFEASLTALLTMVSSLYVTQTSVKREAGIIAEEIRLNRDSPFERCYAELLMSMYQNHRMREEICGSEASIKKITAPMLKEIFAMYYRPDNMILTVCGDVDMADIISCVDKVFGDFAVDEHDPCPVQTRFDEPQRPYKTSSHLCMPVPKPLLSIGYKCVTSPKTPEALFRQTLCMGLLAEMLFARSGVLYDELFEAGLITPTYSYGYSLGYDSGDVTLSCECDHPQDVVAYITNHIQHLKQVGLSPDDFERARRVMYADFVTGFDVSEDIASYLMSYAMDKVNLFDFLDVLPQVTIEEVWEFFVTYLDASRLTISVVSDKKN